MTTPTELDKLIKEAWLRDPNEMWHNAFEIYESGFKAAQSHYEANRCKCVDPQERPLFLDKIAALEKRGERLDNAIMELSSCSANTCDICRNTIENALKRDGVGEYSVRLPADQRSVPVCTAKQDEDKSE